MGSYMHPGFRSCELKSGQKGRGSSSSLGRNYEYGLVPLRLPLRDPSRVPLRVPLRVPFKGYHEGLGFKGSMYSNST